MEVVLHTSESTRESTGWIEGAKKCKFNHPFEHPYNVQMQLMESIFETIDGPYKVGIFESPTGTGKTLSLICSTMSWLREFKKLRNEAEVKKGVEDDDDDEPEWVKKAYKEKIVGRVLEDAKKYEEYLCKLEKRGAAMVTGSLDHKEHRRAKRAKKAAPELSEDSLAPEDYVEEKDAKEGSKFDQMDSEVKKLLEKVESSRTDNSPHKSNAVNESPVKIYFASRTHSQLNQFCSQLRMTHFPSSLDKIPEKIKYLPLGSRKQLCINDKVNSLRDTQQINEACIDLQKKDTGCPYMLNLHKEQDSQMMEQFRDMSFSAVHDIEDLGSIGSELKVCPYYSARQGVPVAEIVSLPYNLLLQRESRESLKLSLKDCVVVIDEAHNLIDTINSIYSSSITYKELKLVRKGLKVYAKKFHSRMNAGNRINISKLTKLVTLLAKFVGKQIDLKRASPGSEVDVNQIFAGTTGDLLNVYPLQTYINRSKIAFKVQTYMDKLAGKPTSSVPLLFKVRAFIYSFSNPSQSGKFFFDKADGDDVALKYLLLDPSEPFREVVENARCVLLAGGTMEPVTDFTDFLFPYISPEAVNKFSCDHIIPDENLQVYPINRLGNTPFEFTFTKRNNSAMLKALGESFIEILKTVPDGVVAFFPSYSYLDQVMKVWKQTGILATMKNLKTVFSESRDSSVETILRDYSSCITTQKGAVLFSVVGGKMSEGINFSDELARAVVMVGLPYPNVKSGDLIAKSRYIEKRALQGGATQQEAKRRSQELYKNICMKAVNQSVGRAIRNIKDYAVIYLIDGRYNTERVQRGLSKWIQKRIVGENDVRGAVERTREFFRSR